MSFLRLIQRTKILFNFYRNIHLKYSPNAKIQKSFIDRYMRIPQSDCKVMVEYVWIDGTGEYIRSKTRTMDLLPTCHEDCPQWSFNGHSTGQACMGNKSELRLVPVALYKDPIRLGNNRMVLCECYDNDNKPVATNHRYNCKITVEAACQHQPMFGMEQEFQLMDIDRHPFGWPKAMGEPTPSGSYYCGVGGDRAFGRDIMEGFYRACLFAGIDICGCCAEILCSQWEFQTGPTEGVKAGDDLWMARYLLVRIAEECGVYISFYPKLFSHLSGTGCHVSFSTKAMREDGGIRAIEDAMKILEKKHEEHLKVYDPKGGADNKLRLTGDHDTSRFDKFSFGHGARDASIRIPLSVVEVKKGYFEDRRPSSNADPYQVINALVSAVCLNK